MRMEPEHHNPCCFLTVKVMMSKCENMSWYIPGQIPGHLHTPTSLLPCLIQLEMQGLKYSYSSENPKSIYAYTYSRVCINHCIRCSWLGDNLREGRQRCCKWELCRRKRKYRLSPEECLDFSRTSRVAMIYSFCKENQHLRMLPCTTCKSSSSVWANNCTDPPQET